MAWSYRGYTSLPTAVPITGTSVSRPLRCMDSTLPRTRAVAPDAAVSLEPLLRPARRLSGWGAAAWSPLVWTALALTGGVLLHADRVPLWVTAVAFALIVWRVAADARVTRLPGKISRAFI